MSYLQNRCSHLDGVTVSPQTLANVRGLFAARGHHLDAGETALLARQVEYLRGEVYRVQYPEYAARRIIPINTSAPPGAETTTGIILDETGKAQWIADYSTDQPRVDIVGDKTTIVFRGFGASYGVSLQEIRASSMAGVPIPAE